MNAIELVMETGFAVTAFLALFLNLFLPEEIEDDIVDVDGRDATTMVPASSNVMAKNSEMESSRQSEADSMDKIHELNAKETAP